MKHDKHNYPHYAQFMNVYGKLKQIEPHNYQTQEKQCKTIFMDSNIMTQQGLPWFATFISIGTPLSLASCGPGCVREWQRLFLRGRHGPEGR